MEADLMDLEPAALLTSADSFAEPIGHAPRKRKKGGGRWGTNKSATEASEDETVSQASSRRRINSPLKRNAAGLSPEDETLLNVMREQIAESKEEFAKHWISWDRQGKPLSVKGIKLFPVKCPLGSNWFDIIPEEHRFTPEMLVKYQRSKGRQIGLLLHLHYSPMKNTPASFSTQYYDEFYGPEDRLFLEENKVATLTMKVCSKFVESEKSDSDDASKAMFIPTKEDVDLFIRVLSKFWEGSPDRYVCVFCTSSYNVSGFMLTSYLVEAADFAVNAAIRSFANSRFPGIFYKPYLRELFIRYDDASEEEAEKSVSQFEVKNPAWIQLPASSLPEPEPVFDPPTLLEPRYSADSRYAPYSESRTTSREPKTISPKQASSPSSSSTYPGLIGAKRVGSPHFERLEKVCKKFLGSSDSLSWFRGRRSLSKSTLDEIGGMHALSNYSVTWRTEPEGRRALLLILREGCFLLSSDSRKLQIHNVSGLSFPSRKAPSQKMDNTLLEGEFVTDTVDGQEVPRLLITDAICVNGHSMLNYNFQKRFNAVKTDVIEPFKKVESTFNKSSLRLRAKKFFPFSQTSLIFDTVAPSLTHHFSGLVFVKDRSASEATSSVDLPQSLEWELLDVDLTDGSTVSKEEILEAAKEAH